MKQSESGRSMIEMLGVLAIIGVLSIGGLTGYTMAMNRWRASAVSDYASRCVVVSQTKSISGIATTGDCSGTSFLSETAPAGYTVKITGTPKADSTTVTVEKMTSAVVDILTERFKDSSGNSVNIGGVCWKASGKTGGTFTFSADCS